MEENIKNEQDLKKEGNLKMKTLWFLSLLNQILRRSYYCYCAAIFFVAEILFFLILNLTFIKWRCFIANSL